MVVNSRIKHLGLSAVRGEEAYVARIAELPLSLEEFRAISGMADYIGVTPEFKKVIQFFKVPEKETPAGFEIQLEVSSDRVLRANLKRNISYDKNDADLLLINQSILSMYHQFTVPDLSFYLKISAEESLKRIEQKKEAIEIYEKKELIEKVYTGYEYLLDRFPNEITVLNGEGKVEEVTKIMIEEIKKKEK